MAATPGIGTAAPRGVRGEGTTYVESRVPGGAPRASIAARRPGRCCYLVNGNPAGRGRSDMSFVSMILETGTLTLSWFMDRVLPDDHIPMSL